MKSVIIILHSSLFFFHLSPFCHPFRVLLVFLFITRGFASLHHLSVVLSALRAYSPLVVTITWKLELIVVKPEGLTRTQAGGEVRSTKPLLIANHITEPRRGDRILTQSTNAYRSSYLIPYASNVSQYSSWYDFVLWCSACPKMYFFVRSITDGLTLNAP